MTFRLRAGILAVAAAAGSSLAQVNWSNPNGSASFFDWANGHNSNTNLFGSPTLIGNSLVFFPSNFVAQSSNGVGAGASDQFNVTLIAHAGQRFTQIQIQEFGDWAITGIGSVQDSGTMFITDLINPRPSGQSPVIQSVSYAGPMPITTPGSGQWSGSALIDLGAIAGPDWTTIMLVFTNTLQASTTGQGSTSNIRKTHVDGGIVVTPFPAPGSGALLGAGCLLLARRRRRS